MNGDIVSLGKKTRDSAKFTNVNKLLDSKIALNAKSTDKAYVWSKEFMLKVSFVSMLFLSNCSQPVTKFIWQFYLELYKMPVY